MVVGATTAAHPLHCRHQSRAPTAVQTPECSRCCVPIATHPLHCTISCNRCGAPIGLHPSQRAHGTAPAAAPIAAPTLCLPGCPAHGLHPATCPGSTGVPTSQGQQSVTEPGARQRGRFALHSSRASPWPCWGARREGFPCRYPLRGSCARGARARQRGRGGVHPESPAAAASTLLSVAQPRAQRGRYLRGPRCQGKAGLAPKLRVGFCSRWKGTRFRCCLASCSLLRGGGGCGLVPGSREDAGAGLRAGRAPGAGWGAAGGPRARGLGAKPLVLFSRATLGHCPRVPPASRCPPCAHPGMKALTRTVGPAGQLGAMSLSLHVPRRLGGRCSPSQLGLGRMCRWHVAPGRRRGSHRLPLACTGLGCEC